MVDDGKQRRDVLAGPWPHQQPRYADAKASLHGSLREVREVLLGKLDAPGRVPWWTRSPDVVLFNVLVHVLTETSRHAGHADILREQLDGAAGTAYSNLSEHDTDWWENYRARVDRAARAADPDQPLTALVLAGLE